MIMVKTKKAITEITHEILCSPLYIEKGTLVLVHNNTEREIHDAIDFFEIVYSGETLKLNFSIVGTDTKYNKSIDLTTIHNINGVLIHPVY